MNTTDDLAKVCRLKLQSIATEDERVSLTSDEAEFLQIDTWDTEAILEKGVFHG